jgi:hypothetical protein
MIVLLLLGELAEAFASEVSQLQLVLVSSPCSFDALPPLSEDPKIAKPFILAMKKHENRQSNISRWNSRNTLTICWGSKERCAMPMATLPSRACTQRVNQNKCSVCEAAHVSVQNLTSALAHHIAKWKYESISRARRFFIAVLNSTRFGPALQNKALLTRELIACEHAIIMESLGFPQSFDHCRVHE